jgi:hypothetical protein
MVDFLDFQKTYVLKDINKATGEISSYLGMFNQNTSDMAEIELKGDTLYSHSASERLYFMPGCTVPRIKVRDFCAKNGGAIVKEPSRATIIFYAEDTLKELFDASPAQSYKISRSHYLKWLKAAFNNTEVTAKDYLNQIYQRESELLLRSQAPFVIIDNKNYIKGFVTGETQCPWLVGAVVKVGIPPEHITESSGLLVKEDMDDKVLLLNSPLLCYQNAIIKHLNTMEIDDSMYAELGKMLESDDDHNGTLAMEIMANCNYDKSLPYLIALMRFHSREISTNKAQNHVNFQTFLKYIEVPGSTVWWQKPLDEMGMILRNKGQNTKKNRDLLLRLLAPCLFEDGGATDLDEDEPGGPFEKFSDDDGVEIMEEDE